MNEQHLFLPNDGAITLATQRHYILVDELPKVGTHAFYLIYDATDNVYKEYVYFARTCQWSCIGEIDELVTQGGSDESELCRVRSVR